ncbi:MAG: hypothetical protein AVDCRST_MAG20-2759, partial [uncultured Acidimicrobiales bacterium]
DRRPTPAGRQRHARRRAGRDVHARAPGARAALPPLADGRELRRLPVGPAATRHGPPRRRVRTRHPDRRPGPPDGTWPDRRHRRRAGRDRRRPRARRGERGGGRAPGRRPQERRPRARLVRRRARPPGPPAPPGTRRRPRRHGGPGPARRWDRGGARRRLPRHGLGPQRRAPRPVAQRVPVGHAGQRCGSRRRPAPPPLGPGRRVAGGDLHHLDVDLRHPGRAGVVGRAVGRQDRGVGLRRAGRGVRRGDPRRAVRPGGGLAGVGGGRRGDVHRRPRRARRARL